MYIWKSIGSEQREIHEFQVVHLNYWACAVHVTLLSIEHMQCMWPYWACPLHVRLQVACHKFLTHAWATPLKIYNACVSLKTAVLSMCSACHPTEHVTFKKSGSAAPLPKITSMLRSVDTVTFNLLLLNSNCSDGLILTPPELTRNRQHSCAEMENPSLHEHLQSQWWCAFCFPITACQPTCQDMSRHMPTVTNILMQIPYQLKWKSKEEWQSAAYFCAHLSPAWHTPDLDNRGQVVLEPGNESGRICSDKMALRSPETGCPV